MAAVATQMIAMGGTVSQGKGMAPLGLRLQTTHTLSEAAEPQSLTANSPRRAQLKDAVSHGKGMVSSLSLQRANKLPEGIELLNTRSGRA